MPPSPDTGTSTAPGHPLRYLARHGWWIAGGGACLVGTNLMAQAIPWVVKLTIESIEHTADSSVSWPLGWLALLIAGLALGQALMRIPSRILIFNAARQAEYRIRGVLFTRLCQADSAFYRRFRIGDLMSRLTNDLAAVRALFGPGVLHVVNTVLAYSIALPLMIRIDPWLTLYALAPYPVLLVGARFFARGIYSRSHGMQAALAGMTAGVQEDLAGIREVKLHNTEEQRALHFGEASARYLHQAMRLASWRAAVIPFVGIGAGASLVIVLWVGGVKVIGAQLSLGDLVAFNLYVGMLAWPTMSIGWILSMWQRGVASWHRLHDILQATSALQVDLSAVAPPVSDHRPPEITTRDLKVAVDGTPVLKGISFNIPAGSICAVVGRVGCGKTTLVEAIARLAEVPTETLFYDGIDVTELPVSEVRGKVAYAPQTAFLFGTTIAENIAYGLPQDGGAPDGEARKRRIAWAVDVAGLGPDLESFPDGLETMVGERGLSLSGGQRQRIALARALYADRPVLILDDSLSSVDADTERQILEGLTGALGDRTVILVSHRLSALQHADQVLVLDRGQVAEEGTHADLLARDGSLYGRLYRRQLLMQKLEINGGTGPKPENENGWDGAEVDVEEPGPR